MRYLLIAANMFFLNLNILHMLPSFFEGFPLVLLEGLASGCRIITSNLSGFEEIFGAVKKETVDFIPLPRLETIDQPYQKDETALENVLSQKILKMISTVKKSPNYQDHHAEKVVEDHTWQQIFKRILAVYRTVIKLKKGGSSIL